MKISRMILRRKSDLWVGRAGRHNGFHGRNNCFLIAFNFYIYTIFQNKVIEGTNTYTNTDIYTELPPTSHLTCLRFLSNPLSAACAIFSLI